MVTYRSEFERKGWHRPMLLRFVLVILPGFVGLIGRVAWVFEQERGGWEGSDLGHHMVEDDRLSDRILVPGEDGEILFEGSSYEEVEEWIESQRSRDFTVPILLLLVSAVFLIGGLGPSGRSEVGADRPRAEVHA